MLSNILIYPVKELNPGPEVQTDEQWAGTSVPGSYIPGTLLTTVSATRLAEADLQHHLA